MTILALEFSSEQRSVAILRGKTVAEAVETGGRHTAAFGLIEKVLADAQVEREQIDVLGIGLGPGSYTGIRSAIALAQGWQLARPVKLAGVSSVEAIAAQAQAEKMFGPVDVVVDAQRGEIYHARYEITEKTVSETGPLRIVRAGELKADAVVVGPEATRWFPAAKLIFPRASVIARLVADRGAEVVEASLEPIYLRETSFVKAPPPRVIV